MNAFKFACHANPVHLLSAVFVFLFIYIWVLLLFSGVVLLARKIRRLADAPTHDGARAPAVMQGWIDVHLRMMPCPQSRHVHAND